MREPAEHIAAFQAIVPDCAKLHPAIIALVSDYSSAYGYIEGSKVGLDRLLKECEFWKGVAMQPVKTRQFVKREKT